MPSSLVLYVTQKVHDITTIRKNRKQIKGKFAVKLNLYLYRLPQTLQVSPFEPQLRLRSAQIDRKKDERDISHSPYGWVSYLHRAATTYYLCCGQALEDSQGAGRIGLTHILV